MGTWGAVTVGLFAGALCALAVRLKFRFGYDDALDVVGVHLIGGLVGGVLIGFLADSAVSGTPNPDADGVFVGGGAGLLGEQILANVIVMIFAFTVTYVIARVLDLAIGLRVSDENELGGLDRSEHAETAYS
jgi:Amt family ammonium transporter